MANGNGNGFVKFTPGLVAEAIIIAGAEEVSSGFAPFKQIKYTLADGRIWYAPLKTGMKVDNLELKPGEAFRVCKRPFGANGSVIDVQRCNETTPFDEGEDATVLAAKLKASLAATAERRKPAEQPGPAVTIPAPVALPQTTSASSLVSGNGTAQRTPPPIEDFYPERRPSQANPVNGNGESATELAMKAAIDVCARGQKYAEAKGLHILFVGEDVRTIMNTILIGQQKRGGY